MLGSKTHDHEKHLAEMKRMLKPGGQVIVIDFKAEATPAGPPPEMRVARARVVRELEQHGFRPAKEQTFLPYQYFLVFEPAAQPLRAAAPSAAG